MPQIVRDDLIRLYNLNLDAGYVEFEWEINRRTAEESLREDIVTWFGTFKGEIPEILFGRNVKISERWPDRVVFAQYHLYAGGLYFRLLDGVTIG